MSLLLKNISTNLHACTIEFYQTIQQYSIFLCGTYQLINENDKNSISNDIQSHNGEVIFICFNNESGKHDIIHTLICTSGILDMKLIKNHLIIALSEGSLVVYEISLLYNAHEDIVIITTNIECSINNYNEGYFLSVDIDLKLSNDCWILPTNIAVSTQNGSILIYQYFRDTNNKDRNETNYLKELYTINNAHVMFNEVMPVWMVTFDLHNQRYIHNNNYNSIDNNNSSSIDISNTKFFLRLISGGDDCILKLWEITMNKVLDYIDIISTITHNIDIASSSIHNTYRIDADRIDSTSSCTHSLINQSKHAQAGVTSAQWHPELKDIFASGSYDEYVRIWDYRNISKGPLLEIHTGGGVWRCKWICLQNNSDIGKYLLVTASMQNGCCINEIVISVDKTLDIIKNYYCYVINTYYHHDTQYSNYLAYGIDIIDNNNNNKDDNNKVTTNEFTFASCSFYDNLIQIWKITI